MSTSPTTSPAAGSASLRRDLRLAATIASGVALLGAGFALRALMKRAGPAAVVDGT